MHVQVAIEVTAYPHEMMINQVKNRVGFSIFGKFNDCGLLHPKKLGFQFGGICRKNLHVQIRIIVACANCYVFIHPTCLHGMIATSIKKSTNISGEKSMIALKSFGFKKMKTIKNDLAHKMLDNK